MGVWGMLAVGIGCGGSGGSGALPQTGGSSPSGTSDIDSQGGTGGTVLNTGGSVLSSGGADAGGTVQGGANVVGGTSSETGGQSGGGTNGSSIGGTGGTSSKSIALQPSALQFGMARIGSPNVTRTIAVNNTGTTATGPFGISVIGAHVSDFFLLANGCVATVAPGSSCSVSISFAPTAEGARSATLVIDDGTGAKAEALLSAVALPAGQLAISPLRWEFGDITVGLEATRAFTIVNAGLERAAAPNITFDATNLGFTATHNCPIYLIAGGICSVTVRFRPKAAGLVNTTLRGAASDGGSVVVTLSGAGVAAPTLSVSPQMHNFGNVNLAMPLPSQTFTIKATEGGAGATTGPINISVHKDFSVVRNACAGARLAANAAGCTFDIEPGVNASGSVSHSIAISAFPGGELSVNVQMVATGGVIPGLVGYWKFDEGSGTTITDASLQGNHGTIRQGITSGAGLHPAPGWATGKFGAALRIDGVDDWVNVPDSDSIDSTGINNNVSVSAWIKLDKIDTRRPFNVVAQRHMLGTRVEQFFMGLDNGAPAVGVNFFYGVGVTNVPLNEWVHMAMTYDGIKQIGYIDGSVAISQDVGWPVATDETPFTMGGAINEDDANEQIDGLIDEVRLYDIKLTPEEIADLAGK